jgi:small subunit ribosomal protein S4
VRDAKRGQTTDWVNELIGLLESRIDNVVFRLGFAPSMRAARQMVRHGHVLVNGKKLSIGSAVVPVGAEIKLTDKGYKSTNFQQAKTAPRLELAEYLSKTEGDAPVGSLKEKPSALNIPFPFEQGLLAEYYAARKA